MGMMEFTLIPPLSRGTNTLFPNVNPTCFLAVMSVFSFTAVRMMNTASGWFSTKGCTPKYPAEVWCRDARTRIGLAFKAAPAPNITFKNRLLVVTKSPAVECVTVCENTYKNSDQSLLMIQLAGISLPVNEIYRFLFDLIIFFSLISIYWMSYGHVCICFFLL